MAGTLVNQVNCCDPCTDPQSVAVPGPAGAAATNGTNGTNGVNAYTTFTAAFTMPAELGSAVATVATTSWMAVNQVLYAAKTDGSVRGYFQVTAIGGATTVTLKNLEDAATSAYADNSAAGTIFTIGSQLQPGGFQGPAGIAAGTVMAGHVTGTIGANELTLNAALGSLPVGNGSEAAALVKGTDGQMLVSDAAAALDLAWKSTQPITGDADLDTDRVPRLSAATGLPIPLKSSRASIKDAGGAGTLVVDARTAVGNARGVDAIDLMTSRTAITQVASGQESVIAGGRRNTAAALRCTIGGGDTNSINALAQEGTIAGGTGNSIGATGIQAAICGGDTNVADGEESFVGGGDRNSASGTNSTVAGGLLNSASAASATVAGGNANVASQTYAAIGGGIQNTASASASTVAGGFGNSATANGSSVPGGQYALADKQGQIAHASGLFASQGDAQGSDLVWRRTTVNAAPNQPMYLDGAAVLATIPTSKTWAFYIQVVARSAAGVSAAWEIRGAIQNNAGTTALVSAVTTTLIADGTGATWGVVGNVVVEADSVPDALNIRVAATVDPATTVRWVATGRLTEVGH